LALLALVGLVCWRIYETGAWRLRSRNRRGLVNPPADQPDESKERQGKGYALDQGAPCIGAGSWRCVITVLPIAYVLLTMLWSATQGFTLNPLK